MKKCTLLCCCIILLAGCRGPKAQSGASLLESRIKEENEVVFVPWNGREAYLGATATFRFRQGSQIRVHFFGMDIRDYVGSYSFLNDTLIEAKIKSDMYPYPYMVWPRMVLRRDGEDLLLYREDGITWWHNLYPKGGKTWQRDNWPVYNENMEGFWPLRASKKKKAEQGGAAEAGRVLP
jgi:hypothetical protein